MIYWKLATGFSSRQKRPLTMPCLVIHNYHYTLHARHSKHKDVFSFRFSTHPLPGRHYAVVIRYLMRYPSTQDVEKSSLSSSRTQWTGSFLTEWHTWKDTEVIQARKIYNRVCWIGTVGFQPRNSSNTLECFVSDGAIIDLSFETCYRRATQLSGRLISYKMGRLINIWNQSIDFIEVKNCPASPMWMSGVFEYIVNFTRVRCWFHLTAAFKKRSPIYFLDCTRGLRETPIKRTGQWSVRYQRIDFREYGWGSWICSRCCMHHPYSIVLQFFYN